MLKLSLKLSCAVVALCLVSSCGKDKKKSGATVNPPPAPPATAPANPPAPGPSPTPAPLPTPNQQDLRYRYTGDNCDTGEQTFTSLDALCAALANEPLNKSCAYSQRRVEYQRRCTGLSGQPGQVPGQTNPGYPTPPGKPGYPDHPNGGKYPSYPTYPGRNGC